MLTETHRTTRVKTCCIRLLHQQQNRVAFQALLITNRSTIRTKIVGSGFYVDLTPAQERHSLRNRKCGRGRQCSRCHRRRWGVAARSHSGAAARWTRSRAPDDASLGTDFPSSPRMPPSVPQRARASIARNHPLRGGPPLRRTINSSLRRPRRRGERTKARRVRTPPPGTAGRGQAGPAVAAGPHGGDSGDWGGVGGEEPERRCRAGTVRPPLARRSGWRPHRARRANSREQASARLPLRATSQPHVRGSFGIDHITAKSD